MPHRPCSEPRCPNYADPKGRGKCLEHRRAYERERSARRRAKRPDIYRKRKWLATRESVLRDNPVCEECEERLAQEVDHVVPLSKGGDPYAQSNLRALCRPCHWAKTAGENRGR